MITVTEQLGRSYRRHLIPVISDCPDANALTADDGSIVPLQNVPPLAFEPNDRPTTLALVTLSPGQTLNLTPTSQSAPEVPFQVHRGKDAIDIQNGEWTVQVPADGHWEPPFPGPIMAVKSGGGRWYGGGQMVDVPLRGHVRTVIDSIGPCCIQWRTEFRWGSSVLSRYDLRWAAGCDTIQVIDSSSHDTAAAVEWFPVGTGDTQAYGFGGGEQRGAMHPITFRHHPGTQRGRGRRQLQSISHISYFNQWNLGWAGVSSADGQFVGVFGGWSDLWERRGRVRIELWEDDERGHLLRFPIRRGRRCYGIVLSDRQRSGIDSTDTRCLLNRRKTEWSDLRLAKVQSWQLTAPLRPRHSQLLGPQFEGLHERLEQEPKVSEALTTAATQLAETDQTSTAVAWWRGDESLLTACTEALLSWATKTLSDISDGGYERLIIFDGRLAKEYAFDFDLLWALDVLDEEQYQTVARTLLALAYMFADPDYCRYEDFWCQGDEAGEAVSVALADEMGDCPVPPNFASEFFSTTGLMAELFREHPMAATWRTWAYRQTDDFLNTFFAEDGTYFESVNYHTHAFNELLSYLFPLWRNGGRNYFDHPKVKGSFLHSLQIMTPALRHLEPHRTLTTHRLFAGADEDHATAMPNDGNSGGDGREHEVRGELSLGAFIYKDSDPELAAQLMDGWRRGGRRLLTDCHSILTLATVLPSIRSKPLPIGSCYRQTLGLVSRAQHSEMTLWALFRAGSATHHMDFDQGNLHLIAGHSVLLGDHGYHTKDNAGKPTPAAATHLHNTVHYEADTNVAAGYTGLEHAPTPTRVHIDDDFDWCVHRIVCSNYRDLKHLAYMDLMPIADPIVHVRHYLFRKPHYFVIWDVFENPREEMTFCLNPPSAMRQEGPSSFRTGEGDGEPTLAVAFACPGAPRVIRNHQQGPLWHFAAAAPNGDPFLAVLMPQLEAQPIHTKFNQTSRILTVSCGEIHDHIAMPPAEDAQLLPVIQPR